ncbi:MAG TPA: LysR substrate-binding domain-containing protein [Burkholderiaceae bacterium]|nr:LysR substrate-binding domain-containing protein [Burkholderiaceae bacterium]
MGGVDKLRAIRSFVRIVDKGSLTAAAADLAVSLPSMVRTLAALERELGVTLLNRTTRRLHLTDDGRRYLEHCRLILNHLQEAEAALHARRTVPQGRIAVTAPVAFGRAHVAGIVTEFLRLHPDMTVEFLLINRVVNLVEEGFDAAIRIGHFKDSSLVTIPLTTVRRVVCASPAYLRAHPVPRHPDDLRAHRCVRFTGLAPHADWPFRVDARRVAIPIGNSLVCNDVGVAIEACASGLGPGAFLSYMVAPLRRSGALRYLLEEFEIEPLPVQLVHPHSRILSAAVGAFAELCVQKLRDATID